MECKRVLGASPNLFDPMRHELVINYILYNPKRTASCLKRGGRPRRSALLSVFSISVSDLGFPINSHRDMSCFGTGMRLTVPFDFRPCSPSVLVNPEKLKRPKNDTWRLLLGAESGRGSPHTDAPTFTWGVPF